MKALVLGGTGFIGMNVVRALVLQGHDVMAVRRARSNTLFARKLGARLVTADLSDVDSLVEVMRGREVVFNCAGHYPRYSLDADSEVQHAQAMAQNTVRAALRAGVQRYVLTSSVATVGAPAPGRQLADERDPLDARALSSVYFACKHAIERVVLGASREGLDAVVLCPTGVMGELDVKAGTGFVIVALGNGLLPFYVEGRTNVVDADDLGLAHIAAAERGKSATRYIIGGHNTTVREMLELISEELGVPFTSWPLPLWFARVASTLSEMRCAALGGRNRPFIAREFVDMVRFGQWVDCSRAEHDLALGPATPLEHTIRKACAWYARHRYVRTGAVRESWSTVHRQAVAAARAERLSAGASSQGARAS